MCQKNAVLLNFLFIKVSQKMYQIWVIRMFLYHQISILEGFLKNHVTLETGVMTVLHFKNINSK